MGGHDAKKLKEKLDMNKNDKLGLVIGIGTVALVGAIVALDYKTSKWKCRYCEEEFKVPFAEYFFAVHTPTRRRLTCPTCGNKGYFKCVRVKEDKFENAKTKIIIE